MTTNKYATLRGTIARAKRHDCQKVVMRVTLAEELLDQLSNAERRIAELEARELKLPKPISVLHRRDFADAHRSISAYPEAEVNAALSDAGIRIHGED
ncbi:hypothetical protein [Enterobacter hormaechei]|uniref:hypothetical protein n=1 Tax=Enterobacter hormaechei TaxID=158836 RepID=UPI001F04940F|nr:hypothetical protein [Enterobacter hormaechei]